MENVLFLQSGVADPYAVYAGMLARGPLYYDAGNNIVAVYDYTCCRKILSSAAAAVPAQSTDDGLNETALWVKSRLARASNHPHHAIARKAVADLFCMMQPANARAILPDLLDSSLTGGEVDWVDAVCRKLPVLSVLKSFDFEDDTCTCFLQYIESFAKLMLAGKTPDEVRAINGIAGELVQRVALHLARRRFRPASAAADIDELMPYYISNLIGLCIQSYDAGRGILSNALLQIFYNYPGGIPDTGRKFFEDNITETLRFDPPVHNTRRIMQADMEVGNYRLHKGDTVLVILAAANRDPEIFERPHAWNIARKNNTAHITFGVGAHHCPGNAFIINIAAETLQCLFTSYKSIAPVHLPLAYEAVSNVRLPLEIRLQLSG